MAPQRSDPNGLLTSLLKGVSRSFYLTLRILPAPVRSQIGLAYLLARATDTIADTDVVPVDRRLQALDRLRQRILGIGPGDQAGPDRDLCELAGRQASPAERLLLERMDDALTVLGRFGPEDIRHVREVLSIITSGQELDLRRFRGAGGDRIVALSTEADLEDYTYRVAGCVGEFWTRLCVAHLFPTPRDPDGAGTNGGWFEASGVQFGKGLQLVNILRDLPRDLRNGRCYVPAESLARIGLQPADLLSPENGRRLRPVYDALLDRAHKCLEAGWSYTCAIPRGFVRLRLACAWPVLIGVRTLSALRRGAVLDPERRIKVSRAEVRGILLRTVLALPSRRAWDGLFEKASRA